MKKPISIFLLIVFTLTFVLGNLSLVIANEYLLAPGDTLEIKVIGRGGDLCDGA